MQASYSQQQPKIAYDFSTKRAYTELSGTHAEREYTDKQNQHNNELNSWVNKIAHHNEMYNIAANANSEFSGFKGETLAGHVKQQRDKTTPIGAVIKEVGRLGINSFVNIDQIGQRYNDVKQQRRDLDKVLFAVNGNDIGQCIYKKQTLAWAEQFRTDAPKNKM